MKCEYCGKEMRISSKHEKWYAWKRGYLCDMCYKMYPLSLEITVIPLKSYRCVVLSMFEKKYAVNYDYFIWEYNFIWRRCLESPEFFLLFTNSLRINKSTIAVLDGISRLFRNNIFLLTFYIKK